jgi:hypothetical protein
MRQRIQRALVTVGLGLLLTLPAEAQLNPVRLKVNKIQKKATQTTHRQTDGAYRQQQNNETIYYEIDVSNFSASPITNCIVKWAVLYDPSQARSHGSGGFTWSSEDLAVSEGQKTCQLALGQKYSFETDPIELSTVSTSISYTGRRYRYGGEVRGHVVEVFVNDRLVATDASSNDIRQQMEKAKKDSGRGSRRP